MPSFTPPIAKDRPPFLPDSTPEQIELYRHYETRARGVNVWILSDNSVVQDTPTAENSNTDMSNIMPGNYLAPQEPYVRSIYIDAGARPAVATEHDTAHDPYVVAFFYGGSTYEITAAQATLLTNYTAHGVGYADCIS